MKKTVFWGLILSVGIIFNTAAQTSLPSFADLAEKLLPSVVNISTTSLAEEGITDFDTNSETLGSGFIISRDGYIVTNQHVIDKAETITVTLFNNERLEAEVIGEDKKTDLAVLKITPQTELSPVIFGDSDAMRVGDWILAIGNPFGLGGSVTAGIISAKSRDIESGPYDNFIQTDAAINQGNSGGPMFNLKGEVIGINSAIFSSTGESMGIGFATPSKMAEWVISQLQKDGKVTRGWIGISIKPAQQPNTGILISKINEGSPAQQAGLMAGDIITKFNTLPITGATNLSRIIAESAVGEMLQFEILRNGQSLNIKVQAQEMPEEEPQKSSEKTNNNTSENTAEEIDTYEILGVKISALTDETREEYKEFIGNTGVIITQIDEQSDAFAKGLQVGNLITKVDKKDVLDVTSFNDYLKEAKNANNRPVLLTIQNAQAEHFVAVKLKP